MAHDCLRNLILAKLRENKLVTYTGFQFVMIYLLTSSGAASGQPIT